METVVAEGAFLLLAFLIILLRQILKGQFFKKGLNLGTLFGFPRKYFERLFEDEGNKISVLFGLPTSVLSFFFLSFVLSSGENSLSFVERVWGLVNAFGDPFSAIFRFFIVFTAAFIVSRIGGKFVVRYVDTNLGELERNRNIVLGIIIFGLIVGGPSSFITLILFTNS